MDYEIRAIYEVSQLQEISVDCNGCNYLVIYGHHMNGGFIAIPNWGICTEASCPADVFYNTERLNSLLDYPELSKALAEAICLYWG